jgi:hypothetical protein
MPLSRLTKEITFNLKDRGYQHNGHDQSHVNVADMVKLINSPTVQEQATKGLLYGYYGHEIRQLYGMIPPETVIINGKTIRLEPCCRTVKIHADADGTVTYQQEFLINDAGEHALTNYRAKIGGFSHSFRSIRLPDSTVKPVIFGGLDYTRAPNFADNIAHGVLADTFNHLAPEQSLFEVNPMIAALLEQRVADTYNSILSDMQTQAVMAAQGHDLAQLQSENEELKRQRKAKLMKQTQRQEDIYASMLCPTRPFSEVLDESNAFLSAKVQEERQKAEETSAVERRGFSGLFGR